MDVVLLRRRSVVLKLLLTFLCLFFFDSFSVHTLVKEPTKPHYTVRAERDIFLNRNKITICGNAVCLLEFSTV